MVRRHNTAVKNIKDYAVPLIAGFLLLILLYAFFSEWDTNTPQETIVNENQVGLDVTLNGGDTQGSIIYSWEYKKPIDANATLYKWERVAITQWDASITFPSVADFRLNKLGEILYNEDGSISLSSWELWVNTISNLDVQMKYASIDLQSNSHVSLSQNEVGSTIYLLSGLVEVSNLSGQSTILSPWQKVTISSLDSRSEDVDMDVLREDIDDYFTTTSWFIKNNGSLYLGSLEEEKENTPKLLWSASKYIDFDNIIDESQISDSTMDITWEYDVNTVGKIELNGVAAELNSTSGRFLFAGVSLASTTNDLIFKIYDTNEDIVSKIVYTLYYSWGTSTNSLGAFSVTNYDVDASQYKFTQPSVNGIFSTFGDFVTIRWSVSDENVASVAVNGYTLQSFNGSTWRYHASIQNDNLQTGTNVYEVKYFDSAGMLIYTNDYTIVKKVVGETPVKETSTISNEA